MAAQSDTIANWKTAFFVVHSFEGTTEVLNIMQIGDRLDDVNIFTTVTSPDDARQGRTGYWRCQSYHRWT